MRAQLKPHHVRNALLRAGLEPQQSQIDAMFALGDRYKSKDRYGKLNFVEFLNIYLNQVHIRLSATWPLAVVECVCVRVACGTRPRSLACSRISRRLSGTW